ncbi:MAG: hypothetical protein ABR936_09080 [Bacteroidota bacterium]
MNNRFGEAGVYRTASQHGVEFGYNVSMDQRRLDVSGGGIGYLFEKDRMLCFEQKNDRRDHSKSTAASVAQPDSNTGNNLSFGPGKSVRKR